MTTTASKTSVLIVDDHVDTADMLRRYLARNGVPADVALSGTAALEHLSTQKPACVILDETMPGMTGLDLLRQLQQHPDARNIPVYFYSAAFDRRKQLEAERLGAKGWFVKGISRLTDLMDNVLTTCGA